MRFIASCMFILRRVNACYSMLHWRVSTGFPVPVPISRPPKSVRDWSGILCERDSGAGFGSGMWGRERDFRAGAGFGSGCGNGILERERDLGAGLSEQRYSGKPDGAAGTPKFKSENLKTWNSGIFSRDVSRFDVRIIWYVSRIGVISRNFSVVKHFPFRCNLGIKGRFLRRGNLLCRNRYEWLRISSQDVILQIQWIHRRRVL